ncbi:heparin sulfate O-sulfotransferase-like [Tigriopus californicus]|uniref:heparin sulfate O-sulfotransferase-like n=1 Tax=Tigriopus californicus TaxID=6832 RepID=UPI0027DA26D1|nr:heparin sulfate O-sulfotransferase-like [Tigriopus californicus]
MSRDLDETYQEKGIIKMPNSVDAIQICPSWNQFQIDRKSFWAKPTPEMYSLRPKFQTLKPNIIRWKLKNTQEPSVLIFNRNRKTGSSYVMRTLWKLSQRLHFRMHNLNLGDAPYSSLSQIQEQQLVEKMSNSPGHYSTLFWNHFFFIDTAIYNRSWNSNWINFVRHPIDWFLSDFYYRRRPSRIWNKKVKPPQEWFERDAELCILEQDPECFFQDGQYRIQQLSYFCGNALECRKVGSSEALKRAISVVDMYYSVVGITEDMVGSLSVMEALLPSFFSGFRSISVNEVINGHPHERNISASAKLKLEQMFHFDMIFYQFAKERLSNQMRILNISGMNRKAVRTSLN